MSGMILDTDDLGPPEDYEYLGLDCGLSNCEFTIDEGCEQALRERRVYAGYSGWNFHGKVWLDGEGSFSCQVWVYGRPVATVMAPTLDDLMHEVSGKWGYE